MNQNQLDDVSLIKLFIQGKASLATSEKLRVQPALDTEQLLARNGQILAIARLQAKAPEVLVRPQSSYTQLISETLQSQAFLPGAPDSSTGFLRYQYHEVPNGYQPRCAPARVLWRQWWLRYRNGRPRLVELELILFTYGEWQPIRNIIFNHSTLFVTTHRGETAHQGEDVVVWAEKTTPIANGTIPRLRTALHSHRQRSRPSGDAPVPPSCPLPPPAIASRQDLSPHLQQVVRQENGRLYIRTSAGELIVEGSNLRCQLKTRSAHSRSPHSM